MVYIFRKLLLMYSGVMCKYMLAGQRIAFSWASLKCCTLGTFLTHPGPALSIFLRGVALWLRASPRERLSSEISAANISSRWGNVCFSSARGNLAATTAASVPRVKVSYKVKIHLPCDPVSPFLGTFSRQMKANVWKTTCTRIFIAAPN